MNATLWRRVLLGAGLISAPALLHAEERSSSVLTALSATTVSGYVDTSAQWNMGTGDANVPNYAFGGPSKADGFNLNVVKLALEKPLEGGDTWGAGYKVDLLFGPDADMLPTQSSGIAADFGIKQAYVALHAPVGNGMDFKLGVWDTIIGYEVFDSISNPNFTRSYGYTIEPTTHTGVQAAYALTESLSTVVGVADTCASTINGRAFLNGGTSLPPGTSEGPKAESYKSYLASLVFTAPTNWGALAGSTLSGCVINGFHPTTPGGPADQTSWYLGGTLNTPVKGLKVGAAYDYLRVSEQPLTHNKSAYANAVALYAAYQLTEKLTLLGRGEYASSGARSVFLARKVFATTGTLQYDLWKNVVSRFEFRWDHSADGSEAFGGTVPGAGTKKNSYILLANMVYRF